MAKADLQFSLLQMTRRIEPVAQTLVTALRIDAPAVPLHRRPLDLVACVDISGSMHGLKIERMRTALVKLVEQLGANDRLAIVGFESKVRDVLGPTAMTPEGKEAARFQIRRLQAMGATAMSGGLQASYELLGKVKRQDSLRRVLLFTDGHANRGLRAGDLPGYFALIDELSRGASASFFGYGENHDGPFLSELADRAGGNYHYAANEDAILDSFARELGGLLSVVATDLQVRVNPSVGVGEPAFLNDFRVVGDAGAKTLHVPDVYAEERRWIVFELPFGLPSSPLPAVRPVAELHVSWRAVGGERRELELRAEVELVDKGLGDTPDLQVKEQFVVLRAAKAQRRAAEHAEHGDFLAAELLIAEAAAEAIGLGTELGKSTGALLHSLVDAYANDRAYRSRRSALASVRKGMGRSRSSGMALDALYETRVQAEIRKRFRGPKK